MRNRFYFSRNINCISQSTVWIHLFLSAVILLSDFFVLIYANAEGNEILNKSIISIMPSLVNSTMAFHRFLIPYSPNLSIKWIARSTRSISSFQNEKFRAAYRSDMAESGSPKKMAAVRARIFFETSGGPAHPSRSKLRCSAAHYIRNKRAAGGGCPEQRQLSGLL